MANREYRKLRAKADKKKQDVLTMIKGKLSMENMTDFDDEEDDIDRMGTDKKEVMNTSQVNPQASLQPTTNTALIKDKVRITMLGTSASGKSSFLSGVHQTLISDHQTKLYLRIADDTNIGEKHASIESIAMIKEDNKVTGFMPSGTTETKSYDLILTDGDKEYCKFEFWDYRGSLVNSVPLGRKESMETETVRFREQLKVSDVILVFADSIRLSQYQGKLERRIQAQENLMNHIFTDILGKKKYHIILVLTKSDDSYVKEEDRKDNFAELCKKAMETFKALQFHAKTFAVIPVSAVGEGNAETVEEIIRIGGEVQRSWSAKLKEGRIPEPENIDLVIMYACRDILTERLVVLKRELSELKKQSEQLENEMQKLNTFSKKYKTASDKRRNLYVQITEKETLFNDVESKIQDISDVFADQIEKYVYYEKKD